MTAPSLTLYLDSFSKLDSTIGSIVKISYSATRT